MLFPELLLQALELFCVLFLLQLLRQSGILFLQMSDLLKEHPELLPQVISFTNHHIL